MKRKSNPIDAAFALLAALAVLCLSGCMSDKDSGRVAGGDDIPNDVEPLGKQSAEARSDSADWNGFKSMPRTSPGMYDTAAVPDSVPDTTGAVRPAPKYGALAMPIDTLVTRVVGFRDADGDGFLAPRVGSLNLADIDLAIKGKDGRVVRTLQRVAAGADLDFNQRGDNRILSSLVVATLGGDTVHTWRLLDADGDYVVLDFSKDTNLVDLVETRRFPGDAARLSQTVQTRLVVWSRDSTRNYAVRYHSLQLQKDGGTFAVNARGPAAKGQAAKGQGADSTFRPGDDALWTEARTFPVGDSVEARSRMYTVRLPAAPGAFSGNLLAKYEAQTRFRNRRYEAFDFSLRPEASVADGRWPAVGSVEASLVYRDGAATSFSGQAVESGMEGTVKAVSGESLNLSFDRAGKPTRR